MHSDRVPGSLRAFLLKQNSDRRECLDISPTRKQKPKHRQKEAAQIIHQMWGANVPVDDNDLVRQVQHEHDRRRDAEKLPRKPPSRNTILRASGRMK